MLWLQTFLHMLENVYVIFAITRNWRSFSELIFTTVNTKYHTGQSCLVLKTRCVLGGKDSCYTVNKCFK